MTTPTTASPRAGAQALFTLEEQRLRLLRQRVSFVTVSLFAAVMFIIAGADLMSYTDAVIFTVASLGTSALFYLLVQTGYNLRFPDPSLAVPQMVMLALITSWAAYAGGETRPLFIAMYALAFAFGLFSLDTRQLVLTGIFFLACYAGVIVVTDALHPGSQETRRELLRLVSLGIGLGWLIVMGRHMDRLRRSLRRTSNDLRESEDRYRELSDLSADAYWEQDQRYRFSRMTLTETGKASLVAQQEWQGKTPWEVDALELPDEDWDRHRATLGLREPFRDLVLKTAGVDGQKGYVSLSGYPVLGRGGEFLGYRGIARDITDRRVTEDRLAYLAQFDSLTGLPNRHLLHDRLAQLLRQARRSFGRVACVFLDLDRFKSVNEMHGHRVGDALLAQVASRLQQYLRSGDTVGRFGADEFIILLPNLVRADDAGMVAGKILGALTMPFDLNGNETYMSASIGIASCPDDGDDADTLLRNAEAAMHRAKEAGRNNYQFYLPLMNSQAQERMRLEASLRVALTRDEFLLEYQPKVDLASGHISGFEALLRWKNPHGVTAGPEKFIPILEETGLIIPVGELVLQKACRQIKVWQATGVEPKQIAVNVSARQFQQKGFYDAVTRIVSDAGISPTLIQLELTESLLMRDPDDAARTLDRLKEFGLRISIDDFGTGFSSLAYLQRFPIDEVKIDRAFIRDAITNPDDATITLAIINLAHSLRLKVVAEGVETEAQLNFLRGHGCDQVQGYFFSRPVQVDACTAMLRERRQLELPERGDEAGAPGVLVVDGNPADLMGMQETLAGLNYRVHGVVNAEAGFAILAQHPIHIVISDLGIPSHGVPVATGIQFLSSVRRLYPGALRIIVNGVESAETLTSAINKAGIHKYLSKKWDAERVRAEVQEAYLRLQRDVA